jgi:peptidoglycan/xylan/chitin deacetylase (PgdA/CDA1 family)
MFHHVRPPSSGSFKPFAGLEITPEFLDAVITHLKFRGYEIIPIRDLKQRVMVPNPQQPFAVLTFDDAYRDNVEYALPVLKKHEAPFTIFVTTGFADGDIPLWWHDMADAIASGASLRVGNLQFQAKTDAEKFALKDVLYEHYLKQSGHQKVQFVKDLVQQSGINNLERTKALCLDWDSLKTLAREPLCIIGAHTLTHPLLAHMPHDVARNEMAQSKSIIEKRLGIAVQHMAYPVGDLGAASAREFSLASETGYETAVTTQPGVITSTHARHCHALPRLSVNGLHQTIPAFDALLSGLPFFLMNKGKIVRAD